MKANAPFVGREDDLRALRGWLTEATTSGPRVVLVAGEPGIGKSTLVERFVSDAVRRKNAPTVLRATCYQDVHVPYLPLATALRPVVDIEALLRPLIDDTPTGGDERRLHLYLGVADAVARACREAPVLLVVDDLQWADQGTLDLLTHLLQVSAQTTGHQPLMAVFAHRTTNDRSLLEFLTRMRRGDWCRDLPLTGLDAFSLPELVQAIAGVPPSRRLVESIDEASAGNPLLARSLLDRLEAFGVLTVRSGHLTHRGGEELLAGPAELDELLRHRLRDLPRACLDLLVAAAFVGDDQPLSHVREVMGADADRFDVLVDQIVAAGVLLDHDVVRFEHPQVRQVMLQRPRGAKRQQLHLSVADLLDSLEGDDPSRAVSVAHHLRRAGTAADPQRVIQASLQAATHAATVVAWGEAARAYDAAIEASEQVGDGESAFVALLHARTAYAHWYNHDNPGAEQHALAAVAIARRLGDLSLWAEALDTLAHARWSTIRPPGDPAATTAEFDEFLDTVADRAPNLRSTVHRLRGTLLLQVHNEVARGRADMQRAAELVDRANAYATSDIEFALGAVRLTELQMSEARTHFDDAFDQAVVAGRDLLQVSTRRGQAMIRWCTGELDDAARKAGQAIEAAPRIAAWAECATSTAVAAGIAVAQARHDDCEQLTVDAERLTRWSGFPLASQVLYGALACSRATRGDFDGARAALDHWAQSGTRGFNRYRPLVDAMAGNVDDIPPGRAHPLPAELTTFHVGALGTAIEIGDIVDDLDRIEWATDALTQIAERGMRFELGWCLFVPRLVAVGHARLGRGETARQWFDVAAADAQRAGALFEAERVETDRARLLDGW